MVILLSMQNTNRFWTLAVAALLIVMLCGIVAADEPFINAANPVFPNEFTLNLNGVAYQNLASPVFMWEDTLNFTGTNNRSNYIYLHLGEPGQEVEWTEPYHCHNLAWNIRGSSISAVRPAANKTWAYSWNASDPLCKYPNVDTQLNITVEGAGDTIVLPVYMRAIAIPPTPDYQGQIDALALNASRQQTDIDRILAYLGL